jgi:hypothetical protein
MFVEIIFHVRADYKNKFEEWCNHDSNCIKLGNLNIVQIIKIKANTTLNF